MAKSAIDYYHELLNDMPVTVSVAGMAAISAALDEFAERAESADLAVGTLMMRVDEVLESLMDHLETLRPAEPE